MPLKSTSIWLTVGCRCYTTFEYIHNSAIMAMINAGIRLKKALSAKTEAAQVLDTLKNMWGNQDDLVASKFMPTLLSCTLGNDTWANRIHESKRCFSQL